MKRNVTGKMGFPAVLLKQRLFTHCVLLLAVGAITGCAGDIKYSHSLDTLPDDPSYFAPNAKISRDSKLVIRTVKTIRAPNAPAMGGTDDPKVYEEFGDAITKKSLPAYLSESCGLTKNGKQTDGIYYVDANIEGVLFTNAKVLKQQLAIGAFLGVSSGLLDQRMIKGNFAVYDRDGNLIASTKGELTQVVSELHAKKMLELEIRRLCGMMEASIAEMTLRNTPPSLQTHTTAK